MSHLWVFHVLRQHLKTNVLPHRLAGVHEVVDHLVSVERSRRESESFFSSGHSGIVNGLHINLVIIKKNVGHGLGEGGIANEQGDDVRLGVEHGEVGL